MTDPHLFTATDAWGEASLWFGRGPEDPRPELVEFVGTIAARKALWEVVAAALIPDCTSQIQGED